MLCGGDALAGAVTALLGALLALSRSPVLAALLTAGPFLLLHVFSLEPASPHSARRVLRPHGAPARIAHRGGAHDAPENTLAAVRQVSPAVPAERRGTRRAGAEVRRWNCRAVSLTPAWGRSRSGSSTERGIGPAGVRSLRADPAYPPGVSGGRGAVRVGCTATESALRLRMAPSWEEKRRSAGGCGRADR